MKRLADWASGPRTVEEWAEISVTALVVAACTIFVVGALHPSKLLLDTTPAGGDMGAHVWAPWFLKSHLFPHGRISGWAPDWYNGFPALTFYFPGPYLAIALLSYVLPYGVAFKLVSVSGVVALPVCAYAFGRLTGMRFPGPPLLAVATVPFLFDRYFTIWGGNIASTLAGEFAFSIALCFALLFIGVFFRSLQTGKHRGLAAVLLAAVLFCHLLPFLFALAGAVIAWLLQPSRRRLGIAILIGVVGLAITAWWLLPFVMRLQYSNDMGWERSTAYMKGLLPFLCNAKKADSSVNCPTSGVVRVYTDHLRIVVALAVAGALGGVALRRRATLLITGLAVAFAAAFRFMPTSALWNARMLPFWYLMLYFAAAACVAESAVAIGVLFGRSPRGADEAAPELDLDPELPRELVGVGAPGLFAGEADAGGASVPAAAPPAVSAVLSGGGFEAGDLLEPAPPVVGAVPPFLEPGPGPGEDHDPEWAGWEDWGPVAAEDDEGSDAVIPNPWPAVVVPLLVVLIILTFVGQAVPDWQWVFARLPGHTLLGGKSQQANPNFVSGWANWNYSGYQKKPAYPEYLDVVSTMSRVGKQDGCGRAMWEYESEEDRFGTPMALMLLPMWTNGCIGSEEGLFFESSATVPYHFLDQSELSPSPSRAMRDLPYRDFDIKSGIQHLQLMGVRYYMAISPTAQTAAMTLTTGPNPMLTLVAKSGPHQIDYSDIGQGTQSRSWEVFEVADSAPVVGLSYQPDVVTGVNTAKKGWITLNAPKVTPSTPLGTGWYQDPSRWAVPLAPTGPRNWARVSGTSADVVKVPVRQALVSDVTQTDDRITFNVDQPGTPVLVKTSYFPNWQATGAEGPWRVTPNAMVVIPTSSHVELHYGYTPVDNAGRLLTVGGLVAAALLWIGERRRSPAADAVIPPLLSDEP